MPAKGTWLALLGLTCCLAQTPGKPPCNARNRGRVWPEGQALTRSQPVEICTQHVWRYRWETLTVHVSRLRKSRKR